MIVKPYLNLPSGGLELIEPTNLTADRVVLLAMWRRANAHVYPTQSTITNASTNLWLFLHILDNPSRVLYMILDKAGYPIGHIGLANHDSDQSSVEIDNVIRGVPDWPGIMTQALQRLLVHVEDDLQIKTITLRVMADNSRAISFYEKNFFTITDRQTIQPLVRMTYHSP